MFALFTILKKVIFIKMVIDYFLPRILIYIQRYHQLKYDGFFLFFVNRNPHIFPQKKHLVEKIEIITAIVTQTWQLCI